MPHTESCRRQLPHPTKLKGALDHRWVWPRAARIGRRSPTRDRYLSAEGPALTQRTPLVRTSPRHNRRRLHNQASAGR